MIQRPDRLRRHSTTGFSLIELLVVIALLSLMVSILFPVFARARETARRATCQNNLKQIALAIQQYTQDYNGHSPLACPDTNGDGFCSSDDLGWAYVIQPYLSNTQVFQCPDDNNLPSSDPTKPGYTDYFYNADLGAFLGGSVNEAELTNPGNIIMNGDGYGADGVSTYFVNGGSGTPANSLPPYGTSERHLGGAVYAFCDGHVKWLKPEAISGSDVSPANALATFGIGP